MNPPGSLPLLPYRRSLLPVQPVLHQQFFAVLLLLSLSVLLQSALPLRLLLPLLQPALPLRLLPAALLPPDLQDPALLRHLP